MAEARIQLNENKNVSKKLEWIASQGAFVIEQDNKFFYVLPADVKNWFGTTVELYAIRKGMVIGIKYRMIRDGRPRTSK